MTGAGAVGYESGSQNDSGKIGGLDAEGEEQQQVQHELRLLRQLGHPLRDLRHVHGAEGAVDQRDRARKRIDETSETTMYVTPARMRSPVPPRVIST